MPKRGRARPILGWTLFGIWAAVFLAGALGELLQIDALRGVVDLKRLFLR